MEKQLRIPLVLIIVHFSQNMHSFEPSIVLWVLQYANLLVPIGFFLLFLTFCYILRELVKILADQERSGQSHNQGWVTG